MLAHAPDPSGAAAGRGLAAAVVVGGALALVVAVIGWVASASV